MLSSLNKKYPFNDNLKINVRTITSVSLGIFLFLLFFQPFEIQNPDFDNRLIILATFGAITLVLLSIFRLVIPSIFIKAFSEERWNIKKEIIIDLLFVIFNSVAFSFFARYVGGVRINFPIVINIVILSISAAAVMVTINRIYMLKKQIEELSQFVPSDQKQEKESTRDEMIDFESENKTEFFQIPSEQVLLIKSANNYIEVLYKEEGGRTNKKLIRNTLKNTEEQLARYQDMIRCHRSYIVNRKHVQKLTRGNYGLELSLFNFPQPIHVSRQYALKVKEALRHH
ncbi:LytTR family transcriptional regulator DNA-binding domain-containing protein [Maribellus sp. CM-23]|uniref:LytR/AlgR family response regulator transcription factor n=1 Tax=Maribellus sp. CM-23 TaxID=2781026 RepID=UPI001F2CE323|nr:LytTR family transcriptional regulator DNA-binding domain-containing protein [Maribellus sp. CM-23]MCE4563841.1 LytTR family transcriptional regulator DNA-binding domain-containing protein [Maribellus sp. CM-23]